jgi:hypothetical protein
MLHQDPILSKDGLIAINGNLVHWAANGRAS